MNHEKLLAEMLTEQEMAAAFDDAKDAARVRYGLAAERHRQGLSLGRRQHGS